MIERQADNTFKVMIIDSDSSHKTYHHYQAFSLIPNFRDVCISLQNRQIRSAFFCFHKRHIQSLKDQLAEDSFQIIFVHVDNYLEPNLLDILERKKKEQTDLLIFMFGYLATAKPLEILNKYPFIDYCLHGHLDFIIPQLCDMVRDKKNPDTLSGIVTRETPALQIHNDKKQVDFPDIGTFYQAPKRADITQFHGDNQQVVLLQASVGCPYKCSFCRMSTFYHDHWRGGYLVKETDKLIDEIKFYHLEKGIRHFKFFDFNFLGTEKQALRKATDFADRLKKENLSITYEFNCRTNCINQEVIEPLRETGLKLVALGLESMSPSQLERFHKKITVEQHLQAIEILAKNCIFIQCYVILFDPLVTIEEIKDSLDGLIELARFASILIHEKVILYTNVAYYKEHHHKITGLQPLPNSLGTAFDYRFSDPVCEKIFPVFEKMSQSYKAESELLFNKLFAGKATGVQEYTLIRFIHLQRLVMLREAIDLMIQSDFSVDDMLQGKLSELDKNLRYLSDKLLNRSNDLVGVTRKN